MVKIRIVHVCPREVVPFAGPHQKATGIAAELALGLILVDEATNVLNGMVVESHLQEFIRHFSLERRDSQYLCLLPKESDWLVLLRRRETP